MTKKELKENSKLIAQFDGWQHCGLGGNFKQCYQKVGDIRHIDDFNYHLSWDRLIPVCKKISEMRIIVNNSVTPMINEFRRMKKGAITFDIKETYLGVVSFINWYNNQKK